MKAIIMKNGSTQQKIGSLERTSKIKLIKISVFANYIRQSRSWVKLKWSKIETDQIEQLHATKKKAIKTEEKEKENSSNINKTRRSKTALQVIESKLNRQKNKINY